VVFGLGIFLPPQPDNCILDVAFDKRCKERSLFFLRNKHLSDGERCDFRVPSAIMNQKLLSGLFLDNSSRQ